MSKIMKILPASDELFHAEGQTYRRDKVNSCFFFENLQTRLNTRFPIHDNRSLLIIKSEIFKLLSQPAVCGGQRVL